MPGLRPVGAWRPIARHVTQGVAVGCPHFGRGAGKQEQGKLGFRLSQQSMIQWLSPRWWGCGLRPLILKASEGSVTSTTPALHAKPGLEVCHAEFIVSGVALSVY